MENKYRVKIGEIELELEGEADYIEKERSIFFENILSQAIEIINNTSHTSAANVIPTKSANGTNSTVDISASETVAVFENDEDLLKLGASEFLKKLGVTTNIDTTLGLAYYKYKTNNEKDFSTEDLKNYFHECQRRVPKNICLGVTQLTQKGYIQPSQNSDKRHKKHTLTTLGIEYIEGLQKKPTF